MTVGPLLAAARQQAGLSVADVARTTRIRGSLIEAIEADDLSGCGGVVYARGHVRNIAAAVGADRDEVLAEFDAQHDAGPPALVTADSEPGPMYEGDLAPKRRTGPNWLAAAAVVVIAVGALAGISIAAGSGDDRSTAQQLLDSSTPATSPSQPAVESTGPQSPAPPAVSPPPDALAQATPDQVSLALTITGARSWVRVSSADGATLFQGLLEQGASKSFTDPTKLNVILGDSGAVGLVVNGQDLGTAGSSGQVTRASFTPSDPAAAG